MAQSKKSLFRRISNWLHLWLGLISGIVVFVVCLTAAIWTFRDEIVLIFTPGQKVEKKMDNVFLQPSELKRAVGKFEKEIAPKGLGKLYSLDYRDKDKSCLLTYGPDTDGNYHDLYLNPYNGQLLYHRLNEDKITKFNDFLRAGHRFFWLPRPFGSYFVGTNCLLFLITLITGFIWWYPTKWTKSTRDKSFKIKWKANWKRLNIDLHNVLGFYTLIITVILTVTGVVFTFRWFDDGYHWLITGGETRLHHPEKGISDTTLLSTSFRYPDDEIWRRFIQHQNVRIKYPKEAKDVYTVYINPTTGHNDLTTWYELDQNSLAIVGESKYAKMSLGQKIYRANFDIHVGTIGGMPTKVLASFASLVGASLPITGCVIWYNRKWGKKRKR
ncbi:PepSY-associated TM helix domain-containing protein [Sphingobacterium siyangense]|uniref:PepSY-associated TM helix domain-containing protein n=1 Tax=Sphingobacterium siyangense TaxID=459529 RepID=UPI003017F12A